MCKSCIEVDVVAIICHTLHVLSCSSNCLIAFLRNGLTNAVIDTTKIDDTFNNHGSLRRRRSTFSCYLLLLPSNWEND